MGSKSDRHQPTRKGILREVYEQEVETAEKRILRSLDEKSEEWEYASCYVRPQCVRVSFVLHALIRQYEPLMLPCPEDERRRAAMSAARQSWGNQIKVYPLTEEEFASFVQRIDQFQSFEKGYSVFSRCGKTGEWDVREFP